MAATVASRPYGWGVLGIQTIYDVLNGKTVPNLIDYPSKLVDQQTLKDTNPDDLK